MLFLSKRQKQVWRLFKHLGFWRGEDLGDFERFTDHAADEGIGPFVPLRDLADGHAFEMFIPPDDTSDKIAQIVRGNCREKSAVILLSGFGECSAMPYAIKRYIKSVR